MDLSGFIKKVQSAFRTPFDYTSDPAAGYTKDNTQEALEEVGIKVENLTDKILTAEVLIQVTAETQQYIYGDIISTVVVDNDGNIVTE